MAFVQIFEYLVCKYPVRTRIRMIIRCVDLLRHVFTAQPDRLETTSAQPARLVIIGMMFGLNRLTLPAGPLQVAEAPVTLLG